MASSSFLSSSFLPSAVVAGSKAAGGIAASHAAAGSLVPVAAARVAVMPPIFAFYPAAPSAFDPAAMPLGPPGFYAPSSGPSPFMPSRGFVPLQPYGAFDPAAAYAAAGASAAMLLPPPLPLPWFGLSPPPLSAAAPVLLDSPGLYESFLHQQQLFLAQQHHFHQAQQMQQMQYQWWQQQQQQQHGHPQLQLDRPPAITMSAAVAAAAAPSASAHQLPLPHHLPPVAAADAQTDSASGGRFEERTLHPHPSAQAAPRDGGSSGRFGEFGREGPRDVGAAAPAPGGARDGDHRLPWDHFRKQGGDLPPSAQAAPRDGGSGGRFGEFDREGSTDVGAAAPASGGARDGNRLPWDHFRKQGGNLHSAALQRDNRGGGHVATISPQQLIAQLKDARSFDEMRARVDQHAAAMDAVHDTIVCQQCVRLAVGSSERELLLELCIAAARTWLVRPPGFGREGRNAATILYSLSKIGCDDVALARSIAAEAARFAPTMNAQETSNSLWALATLGLSDFAGLQPLAERIARLPPTMNVWDVCNALWALAKLQFAHSGALQMLAETAAQIAPTMNAQDISSTLWALATLGYSDRVVLRLLAETGVQLGPAMNAHDISSTLRALATLGFSDDLDVVRSLAETAARLSPTMNAQDVANSLSALATLGFFHPSVLLPLAEAAARLAPSMMKVQNVANLLWALAKMHFPDLEVLSPLAEAAVRLASTMNAQDVASSLRALAMTGLSDPTGVRRLSETAVRLAPTMNAQDVANSLWALVSLGFSDLEAVQSLSEAVTRLAPTMNAQNVANSLWALATLGLPDPVALRSLATATVHLAPMMNGQDVANSLWALATLGHSDFTLQPLIDAVARLAPSMDVRDSSNCLWSLAALNVRPRPCLHALASRFVVVLGPSTNVKTAQQALQSHFFFSHGTSFSSETAAAAAGADAAPINILDAPSVATCRAIISGCDGGPTVSRGQRDVFDALLRLGFAAELEANVLDGFLSTDILVTIAGAPRKLAIEYDGPSHFLVAPSGSAAAAGAPSLVRPQINGATRLRNQLLLGAAGLALLTIPYFEWEGLCASAGGAANDTVGAFLQTRIEEAMRTY